ncbi:uncharacterized protein SPPG_08613 [Spizellomyces punctatus DAOM BR117]|uniref:Hsp70-like protein n=1 Tax=Spizellomyces punctatus (strain DAOM BR117) TaxID=645134 RepID=A0A0L0H490_SPIPD|nr:uncharacterized protein SPPG_08613 [Spizellomyces punctatus DAOM BR117]KNC96017.1 hypothetical protein SPPG_08613 [Spizellomyces punctatus DAOM BR117]|eukprot:XP_016604057.1 hypothetical protein SPPG_08613 [Spizellomyces punctatus DAOM BR117]
MADNQALPVFVGISFGTLYSSVAIIGKDGWGETIANEDGDRNIPSYYAFTGHGEELAGSQAKVQAISNPTGTIVQFRNLLGKKFDDEEVQEHSRNLLMSIVPSPIDSTLPTYEVETSSDLEADEPKKEYHTVNAVTAKYLRKLKETAENFLGKLVEGCVISTPIHFEEVQRVALINAAQDAGFAKVFTIHEPIAAAIAFDIAQQYRGGSSKRDKLVVVLDLGGHQFNVTLLSANDGLYTVVKSVEDPQLGGVHFDEILMDFVQQEFRRKTKLDISGNRRARAKLQKACEQTKRALTRQDNAPCSVESLYEGMDYHGTVPRGRFEMLAEPLYARCVDVIKRSLSEAGVGVEEIDEVLLVGGASRMPRFQTVAKGVFPSANLRMDVEPDEAISRGCATQAAIILSTPPNIDYASSANSHDVVNCMHLSQSLGLELPDGAFLAIIPKRVPIPARRTMSFGVQNGQRELLLSVYEGDHAVAKENVLVAEVVLADLPEDMPIGQASVDVTFTVEKGGAFTVVAKESTKGTIVKAKVRQHSQR